MSGPSLLEYLRALCTDLDEGRPLKRFQVRGEWPRALAALAVPVAIGLAGAGCAREDCADGADNDRDGLVDGADPDCFGVVPPSNAEYAAPPPDNVMPVPAPGCAIVTPPIPPDDIAPQPVQEYGAPPTPAYRAPFPSEQPAPDVKPPDPPPPAPNPNTAVPLYGLPPSR